jgi:hypothetical protein
LPFEAGRPTVSTVGAVFALELTEELADDEVSPAHDAINNTVDSTASEPTFLITLVIKFPPW